MSRPVRGSASPEIHARVLLSHARARLIRAAVAEHAASAAWDALPNQPWLDDDFDPDTDPQWQAVLTAVAACDAALADYVAAHKAATR